MACIHRGPGHVRVRLMTRKTFDVLSRLLFFIFSVKNGRYLCVNECVCVVQKTFSHAKWVANLPPTFGAEQGGAKK